MDGCFVCIYILEDVPQKLIDQIKSDLAKSETNFDLSKDERNLLGEIYQEQLDYIRFKVKNGYFFAAFTDRMQYLGGTVLFLETDGVVDAPAPAFQGIAKSMFEMEHPERVKLNSLLMPEIQKYLKIRGYDRVFVNPLGYQRKILMELYGFVSIDDENDDKYKIYRGSAVLISKF